MIYDRSIEEIATKELVLKDLFEPVDIKKKKILGFTDLFMDIYERIISLYQEQIFSGPQIYLVGSVAKDYKQVDAEFRLHQLFGVEFNLKHTLGKKKNDIDFCIAQDFSDKILERYMTYNLTLEFQRPIDVYVCPLSEGKQYPSVELEGIMKQIF